MQHNQSSRPAEKCNLRTEVYSRVVGYFRPVANWNNGKKEEFADRQTYVVTDEN